MLRSRYAGCIPPARTRTRRRSSETAPALEAGITPRRSLWDADHIIPVVEGGGECDLENIRTLCLRCHRVATAQLHERIRREKIGTTMQAERSAPR